MNCSVLTSRLFGRGLKSSRALRVAFDGPCVPTQPDLFSQYLQGDIVALVFVMRGWGTYRTSHYFMMFIAVESVCISFCLMTWGPLRWRYYPSRKHHKFSNHDEHRQVICLKHYFPSSTSEDDTIFNAPEHSHIWMSQNLPAWEKYRTLHKPYSRTHRVLDTSLCS
jgi:hypothetical protein